MNSIISTIFGPTQWRTNFEFLQALSGFVGFTGWICNLDFTKVTGT